MSSDNKDLKFKFDFSIVVIGPFLCPDGSPVSRTYKPDDPLYDYYKNKVKPLN